MGFQTAEAMVVRKGFSVEQLGQCLEEYASLNVLEVGVLCLVCIGTHPRLFLGLKSCR